MKTTAISHLRDEIYDIYDDCLSIRQTARILSERYDGLQKSSQLRKLIRIELDDVINRQREAIIEEEYVEDNEVEVTRRERQKSIDELRIQRKVERDADRRDNALEELLKNIQVTLQKVGSEITAPQKYSGKFEDDATVMLVHLSDLHIQELIDIPGNKYDFTVAAKRLQLFAQKIKRLGHSFGASKVVLCLTGDFINSDRRLDEMLSNAANRSRAVVLLVHLLRQFMLDLRQQFFIDVFGVVGNEGRAKDELGWSADAALDNYDSLVYWSLQNVIEAGQDRGIRFHELQPNEAIVQIHSETILAVHGHQIKLNDPKSVQSLIGKYAVEDTKITHIICGHIHATYISDIASRNSSLCGANAYSSSGLGYASKAAQNVHIIGKNFMDGVKCDLQDVTNVEGYDCLSEISRMGAKVVDPTTTYQQRKPIRVI